MDTVLACVHGRAMPCLNLALKCLEIEKICLMWFLTCLGVSTWQMHTNALTKFNKIDGCYCLIAHDSVPDGTICLKRKHNLQVTFDIGHFLYLQGRDQTWNNDDAHAKCRWTVAWRTHLPGCTSSYLSVPACTARNWRFLQNQYQLNYI